jgi:WD40 repeat protein
VADVFISYSRRDTEFVNRLQSALEARSRSVWVDVKGIRAGEVFPTALRTAIDECDAFLFVLSPDSLRSTYCADEIEHAEEVEKRILPLLVRDPGAAPVPVAVRDRNWIIFGPDRDFDAAVGELVAALDTDHGHVQTHTRLLVKALEWDAAGQDRNRLLRGAELEGAEAWLARASASTEPQPTDLHRAFVAASRATATRRARSLAAVSAAVAIVALILLAVALLSRREAVDQRRHAQAVALTAIAGRLGVESQTDDRLDHATLLARQAVALEDSVTTRGDLLGVLTRAPQAIGLLKGAGNKHQTMALRPDGRHLLLGGAGKVVGLDVTDRGAQPVVRELKDATSPITAMRFSHDGRLLALGLRDGTVVVLDGQTLAQRKILTELRPHEILGLDFSPDGTRLAASCGCSDAARTRVWNVATFAVVAERAIPNASAGVFFTSNGRELILPQGERTSVLDAATLQQRRVIAVGALNAELSPDGKTLAAGQRDGTLTFVDIATGAIREGTSRHSGPIFSVTFGRDGSRVVTTSADDSVIEWSVADGRALNTLTGFAGCDCDAAISPDGTTLYTNGINGDIVVWDLAGDRRFVRPFRTGAGSEEFSLTAASPRGDLVAQSTEDGGVVVFDVARRRRVALIPRSDAPLGTFAFSWRGDRLAIAYVGGGVSVYNTADGSKVGAPSDDDVHALAFSRDDGSLIGLRVDGALVEYHDSQAKTLTVDAATGVALAVNPHSGVIAMPLEDGHVELLSPTGRELNRFRADPEFVGAAAFSRDGRYLVTAGDVAARLWTASGGSLGGGLPGELDAIVDARISPDSRLVATVGYGGTLRLYDLASQRELGAGIKGASEFGGVTFSEDGRRVVVVYRGGTAFTMPVSVSAWKQRACTIAGRPLTPDEWRAAIPGRPYAPACRSPRP